MTQYEIAKAKGDKAWELVLITSTETDIKYTTWISVSANEEYMATKRKVDKIIDHCVETLETPYLKEMCMKSFPLFASRIYLEWVQLLGNRKIGMQILALLTAEGKKIPKKVQDNLENLPDATALNNKHYDGEGKVTIDLASGGTIEIDASAYNHATANEEYPKEVEAEIRRRTEEIINETAKEEYEAGYPSVRASAERALRHEWQQEEMNKMRASGNKLVWISSHANCSKRCEPWQGKLYSLDKTKGTIDGYEYQPIENATDIYYTTKAGKVWQNGCLSGFNCRHKMIPYNKGNKPDTIPEEDIAKQRELEKIQREMERHIRKLRLELKFEKNPQRKKDLRALIKNLMDKYEEFCRKHNLPCNPWRTEI